MSGWCPSRETACLWIEKAEEGGTVQLLVPMKRNGVAVVSHVWRYLPIDKMGDAEIVVRVRASICNPGEELFGR